MTRYQVADIFTKNLGVENETVIEKQAGIARGVLREKFLAADIGVSGANFLVADSGAVVLVENEGNARLTTTAPKIHIAVAGIEKLGGWRRCGGVAAGDVVGGGVGWPTSVVEWWERVTWRVSE